MTVLMILLLLLALALSVGSFLYWTGQGGVLGFIFGWQALDCVGQVVGLLIQLIATLLSGGE